MAEKHEGKTARMPHEDTKGPVPQRHRLKLGEANGETNPYGNGEPSKVSTVQNSVKGW